MVCWYRIGFYRDEGGSDHFASVIARGDEGQGAAVDAARNFLMNTKGMARSELGSFMVDVYARGSEGREWPDVFDEPLGKD